MNRYLSWLVAAVSTYMWGGSGSINTWVDTYVIPQVKQQYAVTLKRVPINATGDVINKLLGEKQAGSNAGSADLVWVNGENFKATRQGNLLRGPFADRIPNVTTGLQRSREAYRVFQGKR